MAWWETVEGAALAQGDVLTDALIAAIAEDSVAENVAAQNVPARIDIADVILISQSCDILKPDIRYVAACPILTVSAFRAENPATNVGDLNKIKKGSVYALHLLDGFSEECVQGERLIVDFRMIFSLPIEYARRRAQNMEKHFRLASPYLEHFSQAFARFFMRVGLPNSLPDFQRFDA